MSQQARAPKQRELTKNETVTTFNSWKENLIFILSLESKFAPFLISTASWEKKSSSNPTRGLTGTSSKTAAELVVDLELMLNLIASYCPIISRASFVKNSTSLSCIWQTIRLHFGFQSPGAYLLDIGSLSIMPDERPEDLFQRLSAFIDDNLIEKATLTHHGEQLTVDEELSPTLENLTVVLWLQSIHPGLPKLVKQRYGTDLRVRTLASIKPEISLALDSLLSEIKSSEESRIMRSFPRQSFPNAQHHAQKPRSPSCPLCKEAHRSYDHYLSKCPFLPASDKKFLSKARLISMAFHEDDSDHEDSAVPSALVPTPSHDPAPSIAPSIRQCKVSKSPYLDAFHGSTPVRLTLDCGAESNIIHQCVVQSLNIPVHKCTQSAVQADSLHQLDITGEVHTMFTRGNHIIKVDAMVCSNIDCEVLLGVPCMEDNDIFPRPKKHQVHIGDHSIFRYDPKAPHTSPFIRLVTLRAPPVPTTVWPGDFLELDVPDVVADQFLAIQPHIDSPSLPVSSQPWPSPALIRSVGDKIRITNDSLEPIVLKKNQHIGQATVASTPDVITDNNSPVIQVPSPAPVSLIQVDPDNILPDEIRSEFYRVNEQFSSVFDTDSKLPYNGASGPFKHVINMGPTKPPPRKGKVPQYSPSMMQELQSYFDGFIDRGIFARPEDVGIVVENTNMSFLVKKPHNPKQKRLVTSFGELAQFVKVQPSTLPDVDSTLRVIAGWKYMILTDLTSAYFQIPLDKNSMPYCGVTTPFRGTYVYTRSAMGMPGSEIALEELMCRVVGDLLQAGILAKIADDLYVGGDSPSELLQNWISLLGALRDNNLFLNAPKTVICPLSAIILGWIWSSGCISASPHRLSTLSSCAQPATVKDLRSFLGAYKVLSRVIPNCASFLSPLEDLAAGKHSSDRIVWCPESTLPLFHAAQSHLSSACSITLPAPSDILWIVTDGSVKQNGIGATMYVMRGKNLHLAGYFSAKLRKHQVTWIPCEVEALAISAAVRHFSPYIIRSAHPVVVLTDSKPCVQAYQKLCRGEYSNSPRVTCFLSTVARPGISVQHLTGQSNLPSDFASRNAPDCVHPNCQVCSFVSQLEDAAVRSFTVSDIETGKVRLPFTSRSSWKVTQLECPDLRKVHAHLSAGTRPSKKSRNLKDIKRYLQYVTIGPDGLLIVKRSSPFNSTTDRIVVPRTVLNGLITALHLKLDHPSLHQLKLVAQRYFFALDMNSVLQEVSDSCHSCASLKSLPQPPPSFSTSDAPEAIGINYASDIMRRNRQKFLVVRESISAYTYATLIPDESSSSVRDALLSTLCHHTPLDPPGAVVRTDGGSCFQSLPADPLLRKFNISVDIGEPKNVNKNPIAEKAIQELEEEFLRQVPGGSSLTPLDLHLAVARLNTRIRNFGMSSREVISHRDQFTSVQIPVPDKEIIMSRHAERLQNHPYSEKVKMPRRPVLSPPDTLTVGDIVYLRNDKNKIHLRDRYIVVSIDRDWCFIRKFIGNQLRSFSYKVRSSELYKVPTTLLPPSHRPLEDPDSEDIVHTAPAPELVPSDMSPMPPTPELVPSDTPPTPPNLEHVPSDTPFSEQPPSADVSANHIPPEISVPPSRYFPGPDLVPGSPASSSTDPLPCLSGLHPTPLQPADTTVPVAPPRPSRTRSRPTKLLDYETDYHC